MEREMQMARLAMAQMQFNINLALANERSHARFSDVLDETPDPEPEEAPAAAFLRGLSREAWGGVCAFWGVTPEEVAEFVERIRERGRAD